jgi:hypothetical protein
VVSHGNGVAEVKVENAKPFPLIQVSDLEKFPVWEDILDDEADDPSAFPVTQMPVSSLERRFVAARVKLANGNLLWAMIFNLDVASPRKTDQFIQLRIERHGEWFWLARYWDVDYKRSGPKALATFLGLSVDEVFPITYDVREYVKVDSSALVGQVPKEPRERLPREEIIKMAVP